jgi:hypothetical protein
VRKSHHDLRLIQTIATATHQYEHRIAWRAIRI